MEAEVVEELGFQSADGLQERDHQGGDVGLQQLARLLADLQDGRQSASNANRRFVCAFLSSAICWHQSGLKVAEAGRELEAKK